ncbi:HipA domain-containing protein [Flagellimonas lutimaris]|uniref:HipA domain-containing protein n=1 Tax=Flagellimonas lutimaris TaxID=475082 RepID=UPI001FE9D807|nr:HipA domain-containing protein [Allomuricauda lutimaris]
MAHYRQIRSKSGSLSSGAGGSLSPASYAHFGPAKVVYYVRRFQVEKVEFFKRIVFCFVTGNEDMHLKNFSLITKNGKTTLAPAYDLLNSSIAIKNPEEEIALTLKGKKSNLKASDFTDYYAKERLQLNEKTIETILQDIFQAKEKWEDLISISFLSDDMKEKYSKILERRLKMFY